MKEETTNYAYSPRDIVMAAVSSSISICFAIFVLALFEIFTYKHIHHAPPFEITDSWILYRAGWSCLSFFLAIGVVFLLKNLFQKFIPVWLSLPLIGSIILSTTSLIFWYFKTQQEINTYKKPEISFSGMPSVPVLPTAKEMILYLLIATSFSFVISALASFTLPYFYQNLPKKEEDISLRLD